MLYLLDANVLIRAHADYYPIDRVPQFWDWLLDQAKAGHAKIPFEIHSEIVVSDGPLTDWVSDEENIKHLMLDEEPTPDVVETVLSNGYGQDLTDSDLEKIGQDGVLIAYALAAAERTVVTKETSRPAAQRGNRKIPDVCGALGVPWIRDFDFYKTLDFKIK